MTNATQDLAIEDKIGEFTLPHLYDQRDYQLPAWIALLRGFTRIFLIWHRRAGKDKTLWNLMIYKAFLEKGTYFYFLPTYKQAREVIWEGIDKKTGIRFLDHIPKALVESINKSEMRIRLTNGSTITLLAADQYDRIVGTNPVGVVFSEFALQHPSAWDYIRPILAENGGWAVFVTTPRGYNHAKKLWDDVQDLDDWWTEVLTVDDTKAVSLDMIEADRVSGMDEDRIQQEYYCSFEGAIHGAYYAHLISDARKNERITNVPHDPMLPVQTWWDLGVDDSTSIWFTQIPKGHKEIRIIDYYENSGEGLGHYLGVLQDKTRELKYIYSSHNGPHDLAARSFQTGKSTVEMAKSLGYSFNVGSQQSLLDGIEAVRATLPICWFDKENCKLGINALENYRKKWNEELRVFSTQPLHDWASHGADAFREMAVNYREVVIKKEMKQHRSGGERYAEYDPHTGKPVASRRRDTVVRRRSY